MRKSYSQTIIWHWADNSAIFGVLLTHLFSHSQETGSEIKLSYCFLPTVMNNRLRLQKRALSKPASTPVPNGFKSRPFQDGVEAREAGLPVSNPLDSRPFGIQAQPEHSSPQQENTPDLQEQWVQKKPLGYNFANVNVSLPRASNPTFLQRKLMIGEAGDRYEQEADQVAAQVVSQINTPQPQRSAPSQTVQREELSKEDAEKVSPKLESATLQREVMPEENKTRSPLSSITQFNKPDIGTTGGNVIQRVIHYNSKLFVPPNWWRVVQDEAQAQKFNEGDAAIQDNLYAGITKYLGVNTNSIVSENHSADADYQQLRTRNTRPIIGSQLSAFRKVYIYKDDKNSSEQEFFHPRDAFVGKNDLAQQMNPNYVCTLIALIVQEGWDTVASKFKLTGKSLSSLNDQVKALHSHLYQQRYDEALYQGANYKLFGYNLHSVGKPWNVVHQTVDLKAGEYIFSKKGHTMSVTVNQDLSTPQKKQQVADPSWYRVKTNNIQTTSGLNVYNGNEMILNIFYK
ncbi:MAG TPA: hypothetical protein V6D33_01550 [Cyanophyceae cyanobacterium]